MGTETVLFTYKCGHPGFFYFHVNHLEPGQSFQDAFYKKMEYEDLLCPACLATRYDADTASLDELKAAAEILDNVERREEDANL